LQNTALIIIFVHIQDLSSYSHMDYELDYRLNMINILFKNQFQ
jgi:hypothetical protein